MTRSLCLVIFPLLFVGSSSNTSSSDPSVPPDPKLHERWEKFVEERTREYDFDSNSSSADVVTIVNGQDLFITCAVSRPLVGSYKVSFMRLSDFTLIAVGKKLHIKDDRFEILHNNKDSPRLWTLKVRDTTLSDAGFYECHLNTDPTSKKKLINVEVIAGKTEIVPDDKETLLNVGSNLNLTCRVFTGPIPPTYIMWYKDDKIIEYSGNRRARIVTKIVPDSSLHVHSSMLLVRKVNEKDSGEYRCDSSLTEEAKISVFVVKESLKSLHLETRGNGQVASASSRSAAPLAVAVVVASFFVFRPCG